MIIYKYHIYETLSAIKNLIKIDNSLKDFKFDEEVENNGSFTLYFEDIILNDTEIEQLRLKYTEYVILYNNEMNVLWIRSKPIKIDITKYSNLYHYSHSSQRNFIIENGLQTSSSLDNSLGYENLLFFYTSIEGHSMYNGYDIWLINPSMYNNNWYEDPNNKIGIEDTYAVCKDSVIKVSINNLQK